MTVFKFTGQWIIAKNIDTIMGLQATATKRKLELDDVKEACATEVEDRCQDQQQIDVDEVDGSVSPPKITKYEDVDTSSTTVLLKDGSYEGSAAEIEEEDEEKERRPVQTRSIISDKDEVDCIRPVAVVLESSVPVAVQEAAEEEAKSLSPKTDDSEEDINVQELTNECKSLSTNGTSSSSSSTGSVATYISHSLHQPMIVEDSIAKLEAVVVPGEIIAPWTTTSTPSNGEPPMIVDSISRLQAVAVPGEAWGSDGTRSALATTLLTSDDLCDDDDDDFDDDFDEDDPTIIPSYLPPRYHHCPPPPRSPYMNGSSNINGGVYSAKLQSSPPHPYYVEAYPQQNCSRTTVGQPQQHSQPPQQQQQQQYGNRMYSWQNGGSYYEPQQQTIRCAENGKSYLELGSSNSSNSSNPPPSPYLMNGHHNNHYNHSPVHRPASSSPPHHHHPHYHHPSFGHHPHHGGGAHPSANVGAAAMKRCCDGRPSTWCNSNNKQCYKDRRMSMLNLSMFKLSRFRQVSEQSLYRSVLICNTLKQIEREIEIENKEAAAAARQHQQQQMHLHAMHQQQQQQMHHASHLHSHQGQGGGVGVGATVGEQSYHGSNSSSSLYRPVFSQQQPQHHQQQQHHLHNASHHQNMQHQGHHFQPNTDGVAYSSNGGSSSNLHVTGEQQQQVNGGGAGNVTGFTFGASRSLNGGQSAGVGSLVQQQQPLMQFNDSLPPYDHHPLRDNSGRATPFPGSSSSNSGSISSSSTNNGLGGVSPHSDADSGFGDEDCTRPINWGSVLSLSSQSALDPLAGSDLFASSATSSPLTPITPTLITPTTMAGLPPTNIGNATSTLSAHLKVESEERGGSDEGDSGISMMDEDDESSNSTQLLSIGSSSSTSQTVVVATTSSSGAASFATLTTSTSTSVVSSAHSFDYALLDMESELTELLPSWKMTPLSADDILKSVQQPMHDVDMETGFTHIMVGS